jgi:glycosyltransferase involved in cell wall biosynthesis
MNRKGATILVLIPGFAANETDTTCLPSQQLLIKAINNLFPELQIIILAFQYPFQNEEYRWMGNRVIPFNGQNKTKIHRLLLWARIWKKLKQLKNENEIIGIFSCWCGECALVGKYFSKKYSLKHFIWICGQDARRSNNLVKFIKPHPDSLIAISDFLVKEFFKNHRILPSHVVPIGIDISMFSQNPSIKKDIDIIGFGSLIPLKQYEIFIKVVQQLRNRFPNIKTLICGEGPDKEKLKTLINRADLQNAVTLAENKPHAEVLQLMQRSKILLHPSSYEGFGAVCIEALYGGAHVISFCKPVNTEILHWHIVTNEKEMFEKAFNTLNDANTDFSPVLVNDVQRSAVAIMQLFNYSR